MDKVVINFLGGGDNDYGRKFYFLGKEVVFKYKDKGRLRIRSNCIVNKILMFKRCWKLMELEDNLVTDILRSKYVWGRERGN